jgi:uncharacterized protein
MNYLSLGLFSLWVLTELLSGQSAKSGKAGPAATVEVQPVDTFADRLADAALFRTTQSVRYDPAYVSIDYPGGDVPSDTGVCTDVVIRSYRAVGIDLQKLVHEDMAGSFSAYPTLWGLSRPDKNIDHRRVPNLEAYFKRQGAEVKEADNQDFLSGDLVTWDLNGNGLWHIGVVVGPDTFVHNIGSGPVLETGLRQWKLTGHYRFHPEN